MASKPRKPTKHTGSEVDHDLDEALEATFPASDPVSVGRPTGPGEPRREAGRKAPNIDTELVKRLAKEAEKKSRAR